MVIINEQEKLMTKRLMNNRFSGQWPILILESASSPGYLVSKTIRIRDFNKGKVTFICEDLWFYDSDGNETRLWGPGSSENERSESMFDLYNDIRAHPIAAYKFNVVVDAIIGGRYASTNYHNFILGMMIGVNGANEVDKHFGIRPKDVLVSIRRSMQDESKGRIPSKLKQIKLERKSSAN